MPKKSKADIRRSGVLPETVTRLELAVHLGLTSARVSQLSEESVLIRAEGRGRFKFAPSVQAYIKYKLAGAERQNQSSSADTLRETRAREVAIKIAKQERDLIPLDDAIAEVDFHAGIFLESISGLPARITRQPRERQRIEQICEEERLRLSDRFAERAQALRTGIDPAEADAEDDA